MIKIFENDGSKINKKAANGEEFHYLQVRLNALEHWVKYQKTHKNDSSEFSREYLVRVKQFIYNGEFDPGSGWTLAAGLTHASRGTVAILDRQTGAEHVRNLPQTGE